jgi:hypothetical protein
LPYSGSPGEDASRICNSNSLSPSNFAEKNQKRIRNPSRKKFSSAKRMILGCVQKQLPSFMNNVEEKTCLDLREKENL